MTIYSIMYDLHESEKTNKYEEIERALHHFNNNGAIKALNSTYLLDTSSSAKEIENFLKSSVHYNGDIMIIPISAENHNVKLEGRNKEYTFDWLYSGRRHW